MFKREILFCYLCFVTLTPFMANAITAEQKAVIHEHFEKFGMECIKNHPITTEDIKDLKAQKMGSGENVPCFLSCLIKKIGLMDEKGMLQKETALERAKTIFNDEEELKLIEDFLHSCSHINEKTFTDGEKGCERAASAFQCMIENAAQFGFDL